ncbi:MAG: hypothetical protein G01um101430_356 [Parcubacteria group bacterium Gr01-1014_30]|nr:MAG: hypothetical protein G01um101430_356 [Parcubacteria group bacterium Gr01-1014_30]
MQMAERSLSENFLSGIFKLRSDYFYFPDFSFASLGLLSSALGGVELENVRLIHALSGLAVIGISYFLFYLLFEKRSAAAAAVIMGSNHVLLAISRMAMRDNSAILTLVLALVILYAGLKKKSLLLSFLGGAASGFSFYVYFPTRAVILIWALFMGLVIFFNTDRTERKIRLKMLALNMAGFVLIAFPVLTETVKLLPESIAYQNRQLLIYQEGRELQKEWLYASSIREAVLTNIKNGFFMFNKPIHDHGYIYPNYGSGFVDPLGGVLIWVGAAGLVFGFSHREKKEGKILVLSGFCLLLVIFAFLTGKTPNYTRMLVILPFVAYLVVEGLFLLAGLAGKTLKV